MLHTLSTHTVHRTEENSLAALYLILMWVDWTGMSMLPDPLALIMQGCSWQTNLLLGLVSLCLTSILLTHSLNPTMATWLIGYFRTHEPWLEGPSAFQQYSNCTGGRLQQTKYREVVKQESRKQSEGTTLTSGWKILIMGWKWLGLGLFCTLGGSATSWKHNIDIITLCWYGTTC